MDISPLRIGIVGAGFSGTALAAHLHRYANQPIEIFLFEKTAQFGQGDAYRTPYPFHLLNVRAHDMSAFEDEPDHFVNWLYANSYAHSHLDAHQPFHTQFAPRLLFSHYLNDLLKNISTTSSKVTITLVPDEVIDVHYADHQVTLLSKQVKNIIVDKVVLALGNNPPAQFPFPVSDAIHCIHHSWNYSALKNISTHDPVIIVGTGLSMIDAVLTLYHQKHQGKIFAVSRHGLLPLPHADNTTDYNAQKEIPVKLSDITHYLRTQSNLHCDQGGDWRSVVNAFRHAVPALWRQWEMDDRKRFLRHVLPYWNIHRHRVHTKIMALLSQLRTSNQLRIISGRILSVDEKNTTITLRHTDQKILIETKWLINCMGPALSMHQYASPLIHALLARGFATIDSLKLGFEITHEGALHDQSGNISNWLYTLGPPAKAAFWECSAVPEIRKHSLQLAKCILNITN